MGAPRWCWVEGCEPFSIASDISLDLTMHFGTDMGVDMRRQAPRPRATQQSNGALREQVVADTKFASSRRTLKLACIDAVQLALCKHASPGVRSSGGDAGTAGRGTYRCR